MKAVTINDYGTNDVVRLIEVEIPNLKDDEVLVKVHTAGINPIDWKIRNGAGKRLGLELPIALGGEVVGSIEGLGRSVTKFKAGDVVYGLVSTGGFSEYVAAKADHVSLKPKAIDDEQAAAISLGGLTAWQAILDLGHLDRDQRILITGASGSVGSLAVQFAKAKGAYVIGTASGKNESFVKGLGTDEFINYEKQKFEELVKDVDVVFDTVGGETFDKSPRTLKKGGILVTSVAFPKGDEPEKFGITANRVFCRPNSEQLDQISRLCETGQVRGRVATVLPLVKVKEALALSESGKANGKIVLRIGN